jgi:hypothetical protein
MSAAETCPVCGPGSGCTAHCEEHGHWHCDRPEHELTAHEAQLDVLATKLRDLEAVVPQAMREVGWTAADVLRDYRDHHERAAQQVPGMSPGDAPADAAAVCPETGVWCERSCPDPETCAARVPIELLKDRP